jgi:hypothetical protein
MTRRTLKSWTLKSWTLCSLAIATLGCGDDDGAPIPDGGSDAGTDAAADAGGPTRWRCGETGPDPRFLDDFGSWQPGFVLPGARGAAAVATGADGSLYLGGFFEHVSGVPARHVARVRPDGMVEALGEGLPDPVSALAVRGTTLFAATGATAESWSLFSLEDRDRARAEIHRWDGSAWTRLGAIDGGAVFALAADGEGRLYAMGDFLAIGGADVSHFAVLDGSTWSEAHALHAAGTALAADASGVCFAGWRDEGVMIVACGTPGAFVERDLPSDFAPRLLPPGGFFGVSPPIAAIAHDERGALVIAGNFTFTGFSDGLGSLARWDGTRFVPLAGGVGYDPSSDFSDWGVIRGVVLDADGSLVVSGDFVRAGAVDSPEHHGLARVRDGAWVDIPSENLRGSGISGGFRVGIGRFGPVARAPGGVAVTGSFSAIEDVASLDVAIYGSAWTAVGPNAGLRGLDGEVRALATRGETLVAGGAFHTDGSGGEHPYLAEYRDGAWHAFEGVPGPVSELAYAPDGTIWAVVAPSEFEGSTALVRSSDGVFEEVARASGGKLAPEISSIEIAPDGRVFVAGTFAMLGATAAANVAAIEGTAVIALGAGVDDRVDDLAIDGDGALIAAGRFVTAGGMPARHVARWQEAAWQPIGDGIASELTGVTVHEGSIVVSARFDPTAATGELVACFDGTEWHDVASSAIPSISGGTTRLLSAGGTLVLVGQIPYEPLDPTLSTKVAVFTGDGWRAVDSARGDFAYDAARAANGFWLGGSFYVVDGVPADQIAFFEFDFD